MPITISGSTGIAGVDGSASTPAVQGTDTNTGIAFPAADTVAVATGGTERMRVDSSGNVGIGTSSPGYRLDVRDASNTTVHVMGNTSGVRVGASADTPVAGAGFVGTYSNHPLTLGINNAERARIDTSGNFQFNSGYGSVATAYGCRAWVNFNGTGTVAIRSSGNVSSITDNGTGDYSINFTTAMPDANYAYSHAYSNEINVTHTVGFLSTISAAAIRVQHYNTGNSVNTTDKSYVFISVFR